MKRKHCRRMAALFAAVMLLSAFPAAAEQAYTTYTSEALRLSFQVDAGYSVTEGMAIYGSIPGKPPLISADMGGGGRCEQRGLLCPDGRSAARRHGREHGVRSRHAEPAYGYAGHPMDAMMYAYTDAQSGQIIEGAYLWNSGRATAYFTARHISRRRPTRCCPGWCWPRKRFRPLRRALRKKYRRAEHFPNGWRRFIRTAWRSRRPRQRLPGVIRRP